MVAEKRPSVLRLLVSGGQTGVDRAALDAALGCGLKVGGWCPKNRRAEDGPLPARYPLKETTLQDYDQRTRWNVRDSDGTLVLLSDKADPGTRLTVRQAGRERKPLLLVDLKGPLDAPTVRHWMERCQIERLNVAGPRESQSPGIYQAALAFLQDLLPALFLELSGRDSI